MSLSFRTKINIGFSSAFIFLVLLAIFSYHNTGLLVENADSVTRTHEISETIELAVSELKDLETGQRGYLITGSEDFLAPYYGALASIDATLDRLQELTRENEGQESKVTELKELKKRKLSELAGTIHTRKEKGFSAAQKEINSQAGKEIMDQFRAVAQSMKNEETRLLNLRNEKVAESTRTTNIVIVAGGILSILILLGASLIVNLSETERAAAGRDLQNQNRIRSGLIQLSEKMTGELSLAQLSSNIIETITNFVHAQIGAIYVADAGGTLKWTAGYGFQPTDNAPLEFKPGEGLIGQAALQGQPISMTDAPDHYLKIRSSLGNAGPNSIYVLPFLHDGSVKGVAEIGLFSSLSKDDMEYLKLVLDSVAIAFNSAQARTKVAELLEETQLQSEELQTQQEELKTANEELHSKAHELEAQQEELRQTNEELEEQRSALEEQTGRLEETNRTIQKARVEIEEQAAEVMRASQYKSEFLANMSHELRTPLNSILLLAKSLEENTEGNLTSEQTEACATVYSSGVDLLSLINDILDLSKVEAGKLDVRLASAEVSELASAMENLFKIQMANKGLNFSVEISKDCPKTLFTDRLRLEQILKNFLANSLKFTEKGGVTLSFARPAPGVNLSASGLTHETSIAMTVIDTGIGIPEEKRKKIFEAFEQIESSSSRRYGGAGLGLTIATKISQLLGGEIQVESAQGKGSRFTVFVPELLEKEDSSTKPARETPVHFPKADPPTPVAATAKVRTGAHGIHDDRQTARAEGGRVILVIEDDPHFAKILFGFCHERGFKCLLAADGESGLADALEFKPHAIILDLRLPGISGMSVLGSLKANSKLRHIPVHVISVDERAMDVLKMGAIGFLAKPVSSQDLKTALGRIEERLSSTTRKVLVIEDKKVERESILRLIGNERVETVGVDSGLEALKALRLNPFDCMILDLKLPDMSGFQLLEEIEKDDTIPKCPVIVYTGREMTKSELETLNRFSQSIIIKGVRSQERLLDEVTLFIHRVESDLPREQQQILARARHREELFEGKKLLIVDDDMRNVFALRNIFGKKGFELLVAKTGKEAIEQLNAHPNTDVVLMDIMMPEMDGYEAMRRIRADGRFNKLPIIALTAKAMTSDREKCVEAGASDYLAKPIDQDHLLSLLRVWLS